MQLAQLKLNLKKDSTCSCSSFEASVILALFLSLTLLPLYAVCVFFPLRLSQVCCIRSVYGACPASWKSLTIQQSLCLSVCLSACLLVWHNGSLNQGPSSSSSLPVSTLPVCEWKTSRLLSSIDRVRYWRFPSPIMPASAF